MSPDIFLWLGALSSFLAAGCYFCKKHNEFVAWSLATIINLLWFIIFSNGERWG